MSDNYVVKKIKEALIHSHGNQALARQHIISQAMEDSRLLLELTKSHLSGIVAYNIERVSSGRADKQKEEALPIDPAIEQRLSEDETFGLNILKAIASNNGAQFGFEPSTIRRHQKVSQSHVDALHMMAGKKRPRKS